MFRRSLRSLALLGSSVALLIASALPAAAVTTIGVNIATDGIVIAGTASQGLVLGTGVNATTFSSGATAARAILFPDLAGTVALNTNNLGAFAATTSAQLAGVISNETGTGALVFATSPTFVTPTLGAAAATSLNGLVVTPSLGTLTIANDASAALVTSGNFSITLTATGATNVTLPTTGTLATRLGAETLSNKTFRGDTVFEALAATATDDLIGFAPIADGFAARFAGAFVNMVDLTASRSYGLQNASGTVALGTLANSLFFTTTGATNVTLPTTGTLLADTSTLNGANLGAGTVLATKLQAAAADLGAANVTVDLSNTNASFNTNLTIDGALASASLATVSASATGNVQIFGSGTNALMLGGSTPPVHLASFQQTAPSGAGGTAGTAVVLPGSTDTKGQLTVTPAQAGTVDITFNVQYQTRAPICVIGPASDNAASSAQQVFATSTQQKLTLNFLSPVTQAQVWNYICVE